MELDVQRDLPIKKAMSAYVLFGNEIRQKIAEEYPDGGRHLKVTEVVRIIADEWKKMTKTDKLRYKDLAKDDRMRFETELR